MENIGENTPRHQAGGHGGLDQATDTGELSQIRVGDNCNTQIFVTESFAVLSKC